MVFDTQLVVTSTSFSKNKALKAKTLEMFPNAKFFEKLLDEKQLAEVFLNAEIAIVGGEPVGEKTILKHSQLKFISKYGVGLDNVDREFLSQQGIGFYYRAGVNKRPVAEITLGYIIAFARNLLVKDRELKNRVWNKKGGRGLSELTIGIIGLGQVGKELAKLLRPFNPLIFAHDIELDEGFCQSQGIKCSSKKEILENCDVVTLHIPKTNETIKYISAEELKIMRRDGLLINTSRGEVVCNQSLKQALISQEIAGAAMDVFENEPQPDWELLSLDNLIATPHIAGNSNESQMLMGEAALDGVLQFLKLQEKS